MDREYQDRVSADHRLSASLDPMMAGREFRDGFPVLSVGELVSSARTLVRETMPFVWVRGELSGMRRPASGHRYFALKEGGDVLNCVLFRQDAANIPFELEEGRLVLCGGIPDIYPDRGQFQLIVRRIEPEGAGALALAFEQLKARLEAEGLFSPERKRRLPLLPRQVGVVTSATGAVIRDILTVSARRHNGIDIVIATARVQGDGAEQEIVSALDRLAKRDDIDVVIVARGGGSAEDLQAFNTEVVARAVAAHPVPVVSAVGHETDFTICDFAADIRAATPSAAAELVFPSRDELRHRIGSSADRLIGAMNNILARRGRQLADALVRLKHPRERVELYTQRLDERVLRLRAAAERTIDQRRLQLERNLARLQGASPLATLARGYAFVADLSGRPHTRASQLRCGDRVRLKFSDGHADADIVSVAIVTP